MADRTQRKIADHNDIAADDPFAELTRIMGFDPREPARQRVEPRLVPAEAAVDDFDIDLEKELMGEFAAYEDDAAELPQLTASEVMPPVAQAEPAVASEAAYAEAEAPEFRAEEPFHDEFEAVMDDHVAGALEEDFHFEDDFAAAVAREVTAAPQAMPEAEAAAVGEDDIDSHFDAHFERAMTDVDMDFALEPAQEPAAAMPEPEDEPLAPTVEAEAPAPVAAAAPDSSLEDELNALLNRMSAHPALPELEPETWAQEPVAASAPADEREPASVDEANWALDAESAQAEAETVAEHDLDSALLADLQAAEFEDESRLDDEQVALPEFSAADYPAAEEGAPGHEVHFDSDAFDAAMAGEFDIRDEHDEAATPQPAPVAQEEDPVESLKWLTSRPAAEPARAWGRGTPVAPVRPAEPVEQAEHPEPVAAFAPESYEEPQSYQAAAEDYYEPEYEAAPEPAGKEASSAPVVAASNDVPDIETVDVPERVVAFADDLDIPELAFEEDHAETPAYDDLDAEFASLLHEMNATEPAPARVRASTYEDESYSAGFSGQHADQRAYADFSQAAAPAAAVAATVAYAGSDGFPHAGAEASANEGEPADSDLFAVTDDFDYDPDQDESMASSNLAEAASSRQSRGRGLMLAGIIGAVAVVGGLGALALSFGGKGSTGAPAIVKADNQPIKVKPENPGGTVIPNQDNKVYDMVAKGPKPAAPAQQQLVTQTEEPVDVTAQEPPSRVVDLSGQDGAEPQAAAQAPTAKAEDRIEQMAQDGAETVNAEVPVVTPRKVRTMVVKPDGSLVPREDPAPAQVAAAEPLDPAPQHVAAPGKPEATGTVAAPDDTAAIQGSEAPAAKPAAKTQSPMPAVAPIAPQRPSDQPVNVVGEVKPDQVASIDSGAAAAGTWSMQIASQPTEESAQSTYQDLARRYSGVLQGHTANIVKAEVAGKGTFYRVRVPAKSRNEAIALCTSYKAAGGNCFVSK